MDQKEKKITEYLVPTNVTSRFEFTQGFGWPELKVVLIALLIGLLIYFILGLPQKTIYVDSNGFSVNIEESYEGEQYNYTREISEERVSFINPVVRFFGIIIPTVFAFFLVKKEASSNRSLWDNWKSMQEFKKRQKRYSYKYQE